jgi:hypothetical protein
MLLMITQDQLAEITQLRQQAQILPSRVDDIKDRLRDGADVERGRLRPEIISSMRANWSQHAVRDILGESAFAELLRQLGSSEMYTLKIRETSGRL